VETAGLDEAYLDLSGLERWASGSTAEAAGLVPADIEPDAPWPVRVGAGLRHAIRTRTGLVVSAGIGPNRTVAKIASKAAKPDGLRYVSAAGAVAFLDPLPVGAVPGIGPAAARRLAARGVARLGDVRRVGPTWMERMLGGEGIALHHLACGRGRIDVEPSRGRKSVSRETTFGHDEHDRDRLRLVLARLTARAAWSLRCRQLRAGTVAVKVRRHDFRTITRASTLRVDRGGVGHTDLDHDLHDVVQRLFMEADDRSGPVRLVGVTLSGLAAADRAHRQLGLDETKAFETRRQVDAVTDRIRARYGFDAVHAGPAVGLLARQEPTDRSSAAATTRTGRSRP